MEQVAENMHDALKRRTMETVAMLERRLGRRLQLQEIAWYFGYAVTGNSGGWLTGKVPPSNAQSARRLEGLRAILTGEVPPPPPVQFRDPLQDRDAMIEWHERRARLATEAARPKPQPPPVSKVVAVESDKIDSIIRRLAGVETLLKVLCQHIDKFDVVMEKKKP